MNKHSQPFHPQAFTFIVKKGEKTNIFTHEWLDYLVVKTSSLVTIVTDYH